MSYAILRHGKIKSTGKGAALAHNHRTYLGDQVNIDRSLSDLNIYANGSASQRLDALLPEKKRKDAVVAVEVLLTASPEFFDGLDTDRRRLANHPEFKKWVVATEKWAKAEFGKNLVDFVLHMDESTPHIHLLAVPLVQGRLCGKEFTSREQMQSRQTSYAKAMAGFGLQRGESAVETKRKHIPLKGKPPAASSKALAAALEEVERLTAELARAQKRFERAHTLNIENLHLLNRLEKEKAALVKELEALKATQPALATPQTAQEAPETLEATPDLPKPPEVDLEAARAALLEKWKPVRVATKEQQRLCPVVAAVDGLAILHIGQKVYAQAPLQANQPVPEIGRNILGQELTRRGGIAR